MNENTPRHYVPTVEDLVVRRMRKQAQERLNRISLPRAVSIDDLPPAA